MYMRNMHQNKSIDCPFSQKLRYATQRTKIRCISTGIYLTAMVELKTSHTSSNSINNTLHCTYKDAYFSVEQCKCCRQIVEYIVQPSDWHVEIHAKNRPHCAVMLPYMSFYEHQITTSKYLTRVHCRSGLCFLTHCIHYMIALRQSVRIPLHYIGI